jgi:hypothetical protein
MLGIWATAVESMRRPVVALSSVVFLVLEKEYSFPYFSRVTDHFQFLEVAGFLIPWS